MRSLDGGQLDRIMMAAKEQGISIMTKNITLTFTNAVFDSFLD
jgi:hypothetical protein